MNTTRNYNREINILKLTLEQHREDIKELSSVIREDILTMKLKEALRDQKKLTQIIRDKYAYDITVLKTKLNKQETKYLNKIHSIPAKPNTSNQ